MLWKKRPSTPERVIGIALLALVATRAVGLIFVGARFVRRMLAKPDVDAAGLTARDRFDVYADLEYAREQREHEIVEQFGRRTPAMTEAT